MRKRTLLLVSVFAISSLAALAHRAIAAPHHGERMMRARISAHLDDAMDAINATPPQRVAIRGAAEQLGQAFTDSRGEKLGKVADAMLLFQADKLDATKIAELRGYHDREAEKLSDAAIQAVYDVHAALTPAQRKGLVDYVQRELPKGTGGWKQKWMVNMLDEKLDDVFDTLKATPDQRKRITTVKDGVVASWFSGKDDRRAMLNQALQLFAADKLDKAQVTALKTAYLAKHKTVADRVEAAVREVHATLTTEQRKAAVDLIKQHHGRHGRHKRG